MPITLTMPKGDILLRGDILISVSIGGLGNIGVDAKNIAKKDINCWRRRLVLSVIGGPARFRRAADRCRNHTTKASRWRYFYRAVACAGIAISGCIDFLMHASVGTSSARQCCSDGCSCHATKPRQLMSEDTEIFLGCRCRTAK